MKAVQEKEMLEIAPDTSGADKFFVEGFINEEMAYDFWTIAEDFLKHHYPRLKEFHDMANNCMNVPERDELGVVLQNRILNIIYNAAKAGDEYSIELMKELYKTYYKKEYKQLKRFRKISFLEVCSLAETEDGEYDFFSISRILGICEIYEIEIDESCTPLYFMLNRHRKEWDEDTEITYLQFDKELFRECLEQVQEWMEQHQTEKKFRKAERFAEMCLGHSGYAHDYLYLCSKGYFGNEMLYTETLAFLKTAFPKEKFSFGDVQMYAMMDLSIDALVSVCDEFDESMSLLLGIAPEWQERGDLECKFHPENIKVAKRKTTQKEVKAINVAPVLQSNVTDTDYRNEISRLRSQLHEKEQECRHYRQQYDQMRASLTATEEIIKKHEIERAELIALRNHVYSLSESVLPLKEETLADMQKTIAKRKIAIIGGHVNWINKLKKEFPNWKYLDADITRSNHLGGFENVEKVYFYTDHISHGTYGKFIAQVREQDIPFGYLHTINKEALIRQIYKDF